MKQKVGIIVLLMVLLYVFSACSMPFAYPDSGQFYCDELQMMLDFSSQNNEAVFTVDGKEITGYFMTGYDAQFYVEYMEYTADEPICHDVLSGKFKYKSTMITVKTDNGKEYVFLPKTENGAIS